jgi:uncharacterized protein YbaP (TraB family)
MRTLLFLLISTLSLVASAQPSKIPPPLIDSMPAGVKGNPKQGTKKPTVTKAQTPVQGKKYPSLLWEITGNGLKKPSYLFGTMHVSNKLAFHLGDSFYHAIKSVDVVALEQDPHLWQEEYSKMTPYQGFNMFNNYRYYDYSPGDRLSINTFSVKNYDEKLKASLAMEAQMVNGMMYRTDPGMEDFEEETYLDMYIYQAGKKLNKIVLGVENYKESNKLVKEAYKALYKDQYSKRKSYDYRESIVNSKKTEEAYRAGNLDFIDSVETMNIMSEEFHEKFMLKRNDIQAHSIDTILKRHSLFVGVGAAHLPGKRGVIEQLRQKGYTVRPIMMGERNSDEKAKMEKIRVPVTFKEQWVEDSAFSVAVPGDKLYRYPTYGGLNMVQYADMANGSYYMITRLKTNALLLGHSQETILKKIDSVLYENIPGKIISQKPITKQGYKGFEITNKTRKGDAQQYSIYVLPDEIVIFKIAGLDDYVLGGDEAKKFMSSVKFKQGAKDQVVVYEPPHKGFSVKLPSAPNYISEIRNDKNRHEWTSTDNAGNSYVIFKTNLHHYDYIEEDTFELALVEESFTHSSIIDKKLKRKFITWNGYPALDAEYKHTDGSTLKTRYILQGNNYYVLAAKYKKPETLVPFFESFTITPYQYNEVKDRVDSAIGFTVKSPVFYPEKDEDEDDLSDMYSYMRDDEDASYYTDLYDTRKTSVISNDTTGEHIFISRYVIPEFYYAKDSARFMKYENYLDSSYIIHKNRITTSDKGWKIQHYEFRDTASSRTIIGKNFYKKGVSFSLLHMSDTLTLKTSFVNNFFETFEPADTFKYRDPFSKKSELFFADYFGADTVKHKRARVRISSSLFDSSDLPQIKKAIAQLNWSSKKYLEIKKKWIDVLGSFSDSATTQYLSQLYVQVKDTSDLQNVILEALLDNRTKYSFETFKNLILKEPPALLGNNYYNDYSYDRVDFDVVSTAPSYSTYSSYGDGYRRSYGGRWFQLYDTLQLTSAILPELVDLMALEDYESTVMNLLITAVDSGYLKKDQYKQFYNRFLLEAKQLAKKQIAMEEKRAIDKASSEDDEKDNYNYYGSNEDNGNQKLVDYGVLLMPFWEHEEVRAFFDKLNNTKDKRLKFDMILLMLRNGKPVPDSSIQAIAEQDNYRIKLYRELEEQKLLDKFPAKYKKQEDFARGMLQTFSYRKPDSLFFLEKQLVTLKEGKKGWAYFYKYKQMKDDTKWKIAVSGLQPFEEGKVLASHKDDYDMAFIEFTEESFEEKGAELATILQKLIKEKIYEKRASASRFYAGKDSDEYDSFLPDRVKATRYD